MSDEDPRAFARRIQAEIEADAARRRRRDPQLASRERELLRTWADIAPPGAVGDPSELLLDRAERLAMVDANVPTGNRRGVAQVKQSLRKLLYWYLRYLADQVNAFNGVLIRLVRRQEDRIAAIEGTLALQTPGAGLVDPVPDPSPALAERIAGLVEVEPVAVLTCGRGAVVAALTGRRAYGVEPDPERIADGVRDGLDLRPGDAVGHLTGLADGALGTIVLAGFIEDLAPGPARSLLDAALRTTAAGGRVLVVTADPRDRDVVEADLRHGRGLAPATWAHLAARAGAPARLVDVAADPGADPDAERDRIGTLVVLDRP